MWCDEYLLVAMLTGFSRLLEGNLINPEDASFDLRQERGKNFPGGRTG
jgi:hypothetical protein